MAITYVAANGGGGSLGVLAVNWPSGHQIGDIALLFVESCGGEAVTLSTPAGFVEVTGSPQYTGTGTDGTRLTVFWRRADSTSMATPTIADAGDHVVAEMITFRGCIESGNPWDVTAGGQKASASTTTTFESVTTTIPNCMIVLAATRDDDISTAAWSDWVGASLTDLTERRDLGSGSGNGGGIGLATGLLAASGSSGAMSATVRSSVDAHLTIALKPGAQAWSQSLADTFTLSEDNAGLPYRHRQSLADTFALSDDDAAGRVRGRYHTLEDIFTLSEALASDHHDSALSLSLADVFTLSDQWRTDAGAAAEIPPIFPVQPGGEQVLIHGYSTDVIGPAEDGHEQRRQLRRVPVHGLEFMWGEDGTREDQLLASLLYRSELPWVLPFWPGVTQATLETAEDATKVYLPTGFWTTSLWALWAAEAAAGALYVVLWRDAWTCEAQRYTGHGSDGGGEYVTLAAGVAAAWPVGTVVLPATLGYLVGETPRDRLTPLAKLGRVSLRSSGVIS